MKKLKEWCIGRWFMYIDWREIASTWFQVILTGCVMWFIMQSGARLFSPECF